MKIHHFDENQLTMVQLFDWQSLKTFGKGWVVGWRKLRLKSISAQLKLKFALSLAKKSMNPSEACVPVLVVFV